VQEQPQPREAQNTGGRRLQAPTVAAAATSAAAKGAAATTAVPTDSSAHLGVSQNVRGCAVGEVHQQVDDAGVVLPDALRYTYKRSTREGRWLAGRVAQAAAAEANCSLACCRP
jgi:hypothetical protein